MRWPGEMADPPDMRPTGCIGGGGGGGVLLQGLGDICAPTTVTITTDDKILQWRRCRFFSQGPWFSRKIFAVTSTRSCFSLSI